MTLSVADLRTDDGVVGEKKGSRADRPKRRVFSPEYKLAIVEEWERLTESGARGALLRREGLYHSHIQDWKRLRDAGSLDALAAKPTGPKPRKSEADKANDELAAENARLAGFVAFDDGQHGLAQRYWVAGLHAAHTAGDRALGANIIGFMSCQAKDLDGGREAVLLAQTARTGYPGASNRVTAILELRAAEAHANDQTATTARRATDIRRAIDAAFDALSMDSPAGDPSWSYWMTTIHAHGQAGYCHLRNRDHQQARHHLRQALHHDASSREGALRQILLATTYVQQQQPELEPALTNAHRALDTLSGQVDSARCRGHLSRFAGHLQPYRRNHAAREFLERVNSASS